MTYNDQSAEFETPSVSVTADELEDQQLAGEPSRAVTPRVWCDDEPDL